MKFNKITKNNKGFTLIEMTTSLFILTMIAGLFIANYRVGSRQAALNSAAQQMASDIRLAQSYAMGSEKFNGSIPPGGWGIHFIRTAGGKDYVVFADANNDGQYQDPDEDFKLVFFPANISVKINRLYAGTASSNSQYITLFFIPPDPAIYVRYRTGGNVYITQAVDMNNTPVRVVLRDQTTNKEKTISVNLFGLVDVY